MTLLRQQTQRKKKSAASSADVESLAGDVKPHPGRRMTEKEFVEWVDDKTPAEWVDGEVIIMPPANDDHDDFIHWLRYVLQDFVDARDLGRVKGPEFTARFGRHRRRRIPDILFVAKSREQIITRNHVEGPPDLIMEVVSPESTSRDWRDKYFDYEKAGVREYWIIDRNARQVEVYALGKTGKYALIKESKGKIHSLVLPGFYLRVQWLLGPAIPNRRAVLRELGVTDV
jgi:Uma2 family endonuclease